MDGGGFAGVREVLGDWCSCPTLGDETVTIGATIGCDIREEGFMRVLLGRLLLLAAQLRHT